MAADLLTARFTWQACRRIVRSHHPPIKLFDDIADPADWPLIAAAERKTNPRLMETIGTIDPIPAHRRVAGPGAAYLMAPFTHISPDRSSRFSGGTYGVLYLARDLATALFETMHHHGRFMSDTNQPPGWTSQFHELVTNLDAELHDGSLLDPLDPVLSPHDYSAARLLGRQLRAAGSNGLIYPSVRNPGGFCAGLFYPDLTSLPVEGGFFDYHWNGTRVDYYRDVADRTKVFTVTA